MCQSSFSRRQVLKYGALVAATFPAASLLDEGWSLAAQAAEVGLAVPMHLELVTVTDTSVVITWFTGDPTSLDSFGRPAAVKAPGQVLIGTGLDSSAWTAVKEKGTTAYHHVEITGLKPGATYHWRAESNGIPATPYFATPWAAPKTFTTLTRPSGKEIGRVAWLNDLHFGEQWAGLAISSSGLPDGGWPPGLAVDPAHPYWRTMGRAAVAESKARGCNLLLANGDMSNAAEVRYLKESHDVLSSFGTLGGTKKMDRTSKHHYFVTRGNHDRLQVKVDAKLVDTFAERYEKGFVPGTQHFTVTYGPYRFVGLDSNDGTATGVLRDSEIDYLEANLKKGDLTIPLFHHPASEHDNKVDSAGAKKFRQLLAKHGNVAGVYAGHTHRNNLSMSSETGTLPYFEGGAVKEYPGGYTVVRLFEGGYMVNFYKSATPDALAWSEASRAEYYGFAPAYQLGGIGDRSWAFDLDTRVPIRSVGRRKDGTSVLRQVLESTDLAEIC